MSERRIWWSYLGRAYKHCHECGIVRTAADALPPSVADVRKGDLIVHEYLLEVVAISLVESRPARVGEFCQAAVIYQELQTPAAYSDLKWRISQVEPVGGPTQQADKSGLTSGSLYPFNEAGLRIVLAETGTALPDGW
jgi:hypothetical protein